MDTTVTESKIDATHRLQKSGQWHEASIFRDAERKRFREQGMTRAEAGDAAWASMIQEYPSPENEMAQLLARANSPPEDSRNSLLEPIWFAMHALHALAPFTVKGTIPDDVLTRAADTTTSRRNDLLTPAANNPRMFIDMAREMFEWEIAERRSPPTESDESWACSMERQLEWLPELETAIKPILERAEAEDAV